MLSGMIHQDHPDAGELPPLDHSLDLGLRHPQASGRLGQVYRHHPHRIPPRYPAAPTRPARTLALCFLCSASAARPRCPPLMRASTSARMCLHSRLR